MNIVLWVLQGLMAVLFLLAGIMKAFRPLAEVRKRMSWANDVPAWFVRFIGAAEILGTLGLSLPGFTGILPWLPGAPRVDFHTQHERAPPLSPQYSPSPPPQPPHARP